MAWRSGRATTLIVLSLLTLLTPAVEANASAPPDEQVVVLLDDAGHADDVAHDNGAATPQSSQAVADTLPTMVVEAGPAAQADLRADPRVRAVLPRGFTVEPTLAQSVSTIDAPAQWADGHTGSGKTIAVIDTGVSTSFGGTLHGQACFVGPSGADPKGGCGPARDTEQAFDEACFDAGVCRSNTDVRDARAARPCTASSWQCRHGSAVAAVAARNTSPYGVAPGAGVYAIQTRNPATGDVDLVDVYLSLAHVVELHDAGAFDFSAVNLSLGTAGTFAVACDGIGGVDGAPQLIRETFAALRSRGIAPVVSAGNEGRTGGLSFPACLSNAVAVGASDNIDRVPAFSNLAPGHTVIAPGVGIDVPSIPGEPTWTGTSFSAPHAAGAITLLAEKRPGASVNRLLMCLLSDGVHITAGGSRYPRIGSTCSNSMYVHAVHQLFVRRDARLGEVRRWLPPVQSRSLRTMTESLAVSDEWTGNRLNLLYRQILGRDVDSSGYATWMNQIRHGWTLERVAARLYGSGEYYNRVSRSRPEFVDSLYRRILGREPDSEAWRWVNELNHGRSRISVAEGFYLSGESRRQRVTRLYQEILERAPDPSGLRTWTTHLPRLGDVMLAAYLAGSGEYYNRVSR